MSSPSRCLVVDSFGVSSDVSSITLMFHVLGWNWSVCGGRVFEQHCPPLTDLLCEMVCDV